MGVWGKDRGESTGTHYTSNLVVGENGKLGHKFPYRAVYNGGLHEQGFQYGN